MTQFQKGADPRRNINGRPKGSGNKVNEEIRQAISTFVSAKIEKKELDAIWEKLSSTERMQFIDKLLKHILPRPVDELERLSEQDLDRLIEKLRNERLRIV